LLEEGASGLQVLDCVCVGGGGMCMLEGVEVFFMLRLHYWGRGNRVCAPFRLSLASKALGGALLVLSTLLLKHRVRSRRRGTGRKR
jgi:hypothetical protein